MDYLSGQVEARLDAVRHEVVSHLAAAPDALLVVEEYDKLDCNARGLWRQLLQHPERANITSHRYQALLALNRLTAPQFATPQCVFSANCGA